MPAHMHVAHVTANYQTRGFLASRLQLVNTSLGRGMPAEVITKKICVKSKILEFSINT